MTKLDGLETNRASQLMVLPTLQTTRDPNIFAIGDCAACPWVGQEGKTVPPRAQAAHQQASHLARQLKRRLAEREAEPWRYRDFGSLVSLGDYSTVGHLGADADDTDADPPTTAPSPEDDLQDAAAVQAIHGCFNDDPEAQLVLLGWQDGLRGAELREATGLDQGRLDYAIRRIRTRMTKAYPQGWMT